MGAAERPAADHCPCVAVVGIGSPAGDDRAGWLVAQALATRRGVRVPAGVEVRMLDRPGPALLEAIAGVDVAVLVDAMRSGAVRGTVRRFDLAGALTLRSAPVSSHGFGLAETLALGAALERLPPVLVVYAIEGGGFGPESPASAAVAGAARVCAGCIAAELERVMARW